MIKEGLETQEETKGPLREMEKASLEVCKPRRNNDCVLIDSQDFYRGSLRALAIFILGKARDHPTPTA